MATSNAYRVCSRPCFRLRVGDYRVRFEKTPEDITVLEVKPRGQAYRR